MNKRKIMTLALSICMVAILAIGGSLAYFADTDYQTNVFTIGNVAIDLWEDFGDNDKDGVEELIPATGSAQNGTLQNGIEKRVFVTNTGSEEAYVRVHIAIPQLLDDGADTFDASKNILHMNFEGAKDTDGDGVVTVGADKWDWSKSYDDDVYEGNWNYYETTITVGGKEIAYNVYVVTYSVALKTNQVTVDAINQVYMESDVTNDDITKLKAQLGNEWKIFVAAEGVQKAGFANPYVGLNTQFGDPSAEGYGPSFSWNDIASGTKKPDGIIFQESGETY